MTAPGTATKSEKIPQNTEAVQKLMSLWGRKLQIFMKCAIFINGLIIEFNVHGYDKVAFTGSFSVIERIDMSSYGLSDFG